MRARLLLLPLAAAVGVGALTLLRVSRVQAAEPLPAPGQLELRRPGGQQGPLCPLKRTDVRAEISGFVSRVTVRQEFQNPSKEAVEAIYTFPLPEDAAVDDMTITIGDRVIKGEIKRREEARRIYEAARSEGKTAALLDQERPNIFTQALANVMPGARIVVAISYVNLLKYEEGSYEFTFPMVVGPRYTPAGGYVQPGRRGDPAPAPLAPNPEPGASSVVRDPEKITPPITPRGTRAGHDITLSVKLDAGFPIEEVKSQLHEVTVRKEGPNEAVIQLKNEREIPNKDFILRYRVAGDAIKTGLLAHSEGPGKGCFTLVLQPPMAPPQKDIAPKEMVFVIDQTGSQSGEPIKKAKEAMRFCIENLNPGDTFQLLAFNTQVFPCFSAPVPVTAENTQAALQFLAPIQGNGGTDILKAVDYVLRIPTDPNRPRIIAYMTDGYVGNDFQIIDYIRKHRADARIFPFGVGNSVNRFLIEGMAREGRGAPYIITLNTPGEQAAAKFYQRVAKPLLLDVAVEWNGLPVEDVLPRAIPDVFTSGPIIVKGRYTRGAAGEITLRGRLRGQPWSQKVRVELPEKAATNAAIPSLWAREKIEDLQMEDYLGEQTGAQDGKIAERVVALALDYRLMTQHTSFVAVEQRVVNVGGKQRTIDVPVEMPEGVSYDGIFGEQREAEALAGHPRGGQGLAGGGLGGGYALSRAAPASPGLRSLKTLAERKKDVMTDFDGYAEVRLGTPAGEKQLAAMKPEERRKLLRQVKLAPDLAPAAEKPTPQALEVQVWLSKLPADGMAKLKALGFRVTAQLTPGKLLLGTLPGTKLEALLELAFVRLVEKPRFR